MIYYVPHIAIISRDPKMNKIDKIPTIKEITFGKERHNTRTKIKNKAACNKGNKINMVRWLSDLKRDY